MIERTWSSGDRVAVELPMRLRTSSFPGRRYPAALLFGPVALAVRAPDASFAKKIDLERPEQSLVPARGEALTWRLAADPAVLVRPFYAYKEGEPYYLYFDPAAADRISHHGAFLPGKLERRIGVPFHELGRRRPSSASSREPASAGWASASMTPARRKSASTARSSPLSTSTDRDGTSPSNGLIENLKPGWHSIRLRLLDEKPPQSKDRFINVAGFEAIP